MTPNQIPIQEFPMLEKYVAKTNEMSKTAGESKNKRIQEMIKEEEGKRKPIFGTMYEGKKPITIQEILCHPCTGNAMLLFLIALNTAWHYHIL